MWFLTQGHSFTPQQLSVRLGVEPGTVQATMLRLSRVVPLYQGDDGGWRMARHPGPEEVAALEELQRVRAEIDAARACLVKVEARLRDRRDLLHKGLKVRRVQRRLEELARQLRAE